MATHTSFQLFGCLMGNDSLSQTIKKKSLSPILQPASGPRKLSGNPFVTACEMDDSGLIYYIRFSVLIVKMLSCDKESIPFDIISVSVTFLLVKFTMFAIGIHYIISWFDFALFTVGVRLLHLFQYLSE